MHSIVVCSLLFYLNLLDLTQFCNGQDYIVNIGPDTGYKSVEYVGCTTFGCSISKTWLVNGSCIDATLTISVVETDFASSNEITNISINGEYIGSCEPLDQDCTYDWITCDITPYDLTQKVNLAASGGSFTVQLDASGVVNYCPYTASNNISYYIYGAVELQCQLPPNVTTAAPTPATAAPTDSPTTPSFAPTAAPTSPDYIWYINNSSLPIRFSKSFGCTTFGCNVSKLFEFNGRCDVPWMTISVIENDYASPTVEYVDVYLDNTFVGICEGLNADCTYDNVNCTNFNQLNISSYVSNPGMNSHDSLLVTLDVPVGVNYCAYNSVYYLFATVTFGCEYPTLAPSNAPTSPTVSPTNNPTNIDYYFYPGTNGRYKDVESFGCTTAGCGVRKEWLIVGECVNPRLTIDVVETDFASSTEYIYVYISDNYMGSCEPLDEDCTSDWITCTLADQLNLTSIVDLDSTGGWFDVYLLISTEVNICPYAPGDGSSYYLYSQVTVQCDLPSNITTPAPTTAAPSEDPSPYPTPTPTTPAPVAPVLFDVGENDEYSVSQSFGCSFAGCTTTQRFEIEGICDNPRISVSIVETDYESLSEEAYVYLNGNFITSCEPLDADCSYNVTECSGMIDYDLSSYVNNNKTYKKSKNLQLTQFFVCHCV